jgi:hypothetical protein
MTKASSFLLRVLLPLVFPEGLFPVPEVAKPGFAFPPTGFPEDLGAVGATSSQKPAPTKTRSLFSEWYRMSYLKHRKWGYGLTSNMMCPHDSQTLYPEE